ncbi:MULTISPECIES: ImmA/IrrE family metallo-endopeptidase [unclassified Herbaspirillum]|uniref:ImmA/IrrE family metallo-endopeptidase n=1 Tax=unclassified Herbaspirillum TaxID=2624150 RepID=UPI0011525CEC|nr:MULTISPECIES: ImmA/IrrE family metallo-endopeptidase [unclassified Herbaspirillum]MBB5393032.1 Zn-dependent peptidase ImmA (M78 family) [Herbaspirillum sp. SJZ102]TQK04323.1 Zn-dependent peptidase ImmA (M78 family) [Herbaspirillum sp. SJZ130]TQK09892.1 Zn-dependent peptidase ImmA (M78 family) [Herbaspirillum sp. SJZ106]
MTDPTTPVAWGIRLSKLWLQAGQSFPVDVKTLALDFTKQKFEDPIGVVVNHGIDGIDGMLSKRKKHKDWCISFDENVAIPGRINFTIAHEFGHYLLHRTLRDDFKCSQAEMMDYDSLESKRIESQANVFASYLLMPRTDFEQQITGQEVTFDLLGNCAERYKTSLTATALKWLEFTHEAAMLVVADSDDFICWTFCSQLAKRLGCYKAPGEMIPPSVVEYLQTNTADRRIPRRVAPGIWHATAETIESVVVSDQYEQKIFLLRFPYASNVVYEEEEEKDAFAVLSEKSKGLNWKK